MPASFAVLELVVLLLPGFVAASVFGLLFPRRDVSEFRQTMEALVYSFVIYTLFSGVVCFFPKVQPVRAEVTGLESGAAARPPTIEAGAPEFQVHVRYGFAGLGVLLALACGLGVLLAVASLKDWHMRVLRKFGATRRTAQNSVWLDAFYGQYGKCWVTLHLADGRRLFGWPEHFPDDSSGCLFLSRARWLLPNGCTSDIPEPGILITPRLLIEMVQFTERRRDLDTKEASGSSGGQDKARQGELQPSPAP